MIRNATIPISYQHRAALKIEAKLLGLDCAETALEMILAEHFARNPMYQELAEARKKAADAAEKDVIAKYAAKDGDEIPL